MYLKLIGNIEFCVEIKKNRSDRTRYDNNISKLASGDRIKTNTQLASNNYLSYYTVPN